MSGAENKYIEIIKTQLRAAGLKDDQIVIEKAAKISMLQDSQAMVVSVKLDGNPELVKLGEFQNAYLNGASELNNPELVDRLLENFGKLLGERYKNPDMETPSLTTNMILLSRVPAYAAAMDEFPPSGLQQRTASCDINAGQQQERHGCTVAH